MEGSFPVEAIVPSMGTLSVKPIGFVEHYTLYNHIHYNKIYSFNPRNIGKDWSIGIFH